jgi:hypothetical protein
MSEESRCDFRQKNEILLFFKGTKSAMGQTASHLKDIMDFFSHWFKWPVREVDHSRPSTEVSKHVHLHLQPPYDFAVTELIFYFYHAWSDCGKSRENLI